MRFAPLIVRYNGVEKERPKAIFTPKKFDNVPTDELCIDNPNQFVIIKKRFKPVLTTSLAGFKVMMMF